MMTDHELVSRVIRGEHDAFRALIDKHKRLVSFMVAKIVRNAEEHEEICQDVFLKVYDKLTDFNFESKLSTWIATIAYRHALNARRKSSRELISLDEPEAVERNLTDFDTPETILTEADMDSYIISFIEELPTQYKMVINLYHIEEMQYDEISTVTGMPQGTVKSYLFRARALLREKILLLEKKESTYENRR